MILADRHPTPGQISVLPDGRYMSASTRGKVLHASLESGAFDDPWVPEYLTVKYGRGRPIEWERRQVIMELPMSLGCWEGCINFVDRQGHIHLFGMRFLKWPEDREDPKLHEQRTDAYHVVSRDGGATWEGPVRLDYGEEFTAAIMNVVHLTTGRIVLPLEYFDVERAVGKYVSKSCYSDDGGRTWRHDSTHLPVASGGQHSHSGAVEPVVAELDGGRVWMLIRTQLGCFYESFSDDGRIWSPSQPSRFKSSSSPGEAIRLRDGRLLFVWTNGIGPPFASDMLSEWADYPTESWCRHVFNVAVSHDNGATWRGYREIVRTIGHEPDGARVGYPRFAELPEGDVLVQFGHHSGGERADCEYVYVDPDRLDETSDREDFVNGLAGWSFSGATAVQTVLLDEEHALRLQSDGEGLFGAERNFPFAERGRLSFQLRRDESSSGVDLVLDETYWDPRDRRRNGAIDISLDADLAPSGAWVPVTVSWDVAEQAADVSVGDQQRRIPIEHAPLGICYLTFYGRTPGAESGATLVRRLEAVVED